MTKKKSFVSSWFFDSSFIASANNEILADPFWVDHPKMGVVPFEDGDMGGQNLQGYLSSYKKRWLKPYI